MPISVDSTQNILDRIHYLQNMVIDFHYQENEWFKQYGGALISLVIIVITLLGQLLIFRLSKKKELALFEINRKKEIHIKVAELYGKYKSLSIMYVTSFYDYNTCDVRLKFQSFLLKYYNGIIADDEEIGQSDPEEIQSYYNYQQKLTKEIPITRVDCDKCFLTYRSQKLEIHEILHQIHFYFKDETLSTLIQEFQTISIYRFKETQFISKMLDNEYFESHLAENVIPITKTLNLMNKKITDRILLLS